MPDTQPPADMESRFIAAAIRPFSNNAESEMAAEDYLRKQLSSGANESLTSSLARWEIVDRKKFPGLWRVMLLLLLAITTLAAIAWTANTTWQRTRNGRSLSIDPALWFYDYPVIDDESVARGLGREQSLLLFGDLSEYRLPARAKALWDRDPGNASFFADFAVAHLVESGRLPPDFLETARRIDPRNSWYTYLAAGAFANDAVGPRLKTADTPVWRVNDPTAFSTALELLHQAGEQPVYQDPRPDLWKRRAPLLPADGPSARVYSMGYLFGKGWSDQADSALGSLGKAIAAKAMLCVEENDSAAFRELLADSRKFFRARMDSEVQTQLAETYFVSFAHTAVEDLALAAARLGLIGEADQLKALGDRIDGWTRSEKSAAESAGLKLADLKGGGLVSLVGIGDPATLDEEKLKPGRIVDHAVATTAFAGAAAVLLLICLSAAALYRFRASPMIRKLSKRAELLLDFRDWTSLLFLGVVLPVAYTVSALNLTPLGGHDLGLQHTAVMMPTGDEAGLAAMQFGGLVMLILHSCTSVAGWRLSKKAPLQGFHPFARHIGWLMVAFAAAFIPGIGWAALTSSEMGTYLALAAALPPLIWLMFLSVVALAAPSGRLWYLVTVSRPLVTAFAFAALLMLLTAGSSLRSAYKWFAADELIKLDPIHPAMTIREHEAALKMRNDLRQVLGYEP